MSSLDPFYVFRTSVFVAVTVYTCLSMAGTMLQVIGILRGTDPKKQLLRAIVAYELVSFRLRPLAGELLGISLWFAALLFVWWLHTQV
jgi:hypothetical protein